MIDAPARHEIERRIIRDPGRKRLKVIRRPDVVVTDIGDPGSACRSDTVVVREALAAGIVRQIAPDDPLLREGPNRRLGFVAASVADHDQLEIGVGLAEQRHDGRSDVSSAPVGGGTIEKNGASVIEAERDSPVAGIEAALIRFIGAIWHRRHVHEGRRLAADILDPVNDIGRNAQQRRTFAAEHENVQHVARRAVRAGGSQEILTGPAERAIGRRRRSTRPAIRLIGAW